MKVFSIPLNFRHGMRLVRSPKIKIPKEIEVPVFLIRHELQSRMLFKHFQMIGFQECDFETFLDRLILASLRMWDGTDKTFKIYFDLMEKWSDNINSDDEIITKRALRIYYALVKARDKQSKTRIQGRRKEKLENR